MPDSPQPESQAPVEADFATQQAVLPTPPSNPNLPTSWFSRHGFGIFYVCLVLAVCTSLGWVGQRIFKSVFAFVSAQSQKTARDAASRRRIYPSADPILQGQAENLLGRLASGDLSAAEQIGMQSAGWTGRTQRTQKTSEFLSAAINSGDLRIRKAAVQAQLALDGVPQNEAGLKMLESAVGDPRRRPWALWLLGALANQGVDPNHAAKIIETYLDDSDVRIRSTAVDGLALVATDETVPMLLDRFRNDPSPVVQERAICDLAQSGMYSHEQRMVAGASLVGWLNDSLLTVQQRNWTLQALHDITGASVGTDANAWRKWWSHNSHS